MMPVEYDITGKVVFITGAGRGIGKGIARVFAAKSAQVLVVARNSGPAEATSGLRSVSPR